MSSVASKTTRGGCSFENLLRGKEKNYACDPAYLVDLRGVNDIDIAEQKLVANVENIFTELEIQRECNVVKFYIGKTFIHKNKRRKEFNPMDPFTWKKTGIKSRWDKHSKTLYGRDGLVVLTAITRDALPTNVSIDKQEGYALD